MPRMRRPCLGWKHPDELIDRPSINNIKHTVLASENGELVGDGEFLEADAARVGLVAGQERPCAELSQFLSRQSLWRIQNKLGTHSRAHAAAI